MYLRILYVQYCNHSKLWSDLCIVPLYLPTMEKYTIWSRVLNDYNTIYKVSQEECAILRESVPCVKVYRYNPKHLYPKLNGYGDNGQRSLKLGQLLHTY